MVRYFIALIIVMLALAAFATQEAQAQFYCDGALPSRLYNGGAGQVTPGLPNTLRSHPYRGGDSIVLGQIPSGGAFTVIGGPSCYDSMYWWLVRYNGTTGWTPEAGGGVYWLQPITADSDCMALPSRLTTGQYGRVTVGGLPNVLRTQPHRGYGSSVVTNIPAGGTFYIITGAACGEGITWWQVNYNGLTGWTGEGHGNQYWLEPFNSQPPPGNCPMMPTRMMVGYTGVVSPGAPNRLRATASLNGQVLANMTAGETFSVVSGWVCADNLTWWQVNYRGKTLDSGRTVRALLHRPGIVPGLSGVAHQRGQAGADHARVAEPPAQQRVNRRHRTRADSGRRDLQRDQRADLQRKRGLVARELSGLGRLDDGRTGRAILDRASIGATLQRSSMSLCIKGRSDTICPCQRLPC